MFATRISFVLSVAGSIVLLCSCANTISLKPQQVNQPQAQKQELVTRPDQAPEPEAESLPVVYPDTNPSVPEGKLLWEKYNCAQCHGVTGTGTVKATDMTHGLITQGTPNKVYRILAYGLPNWDHPTFKDKLTTRQIWNLVFFVRSLGEPQLTEAQLKEMEPVFGSNCADCHGENGFGDGPLSKHLNPMSANFHQFNRFYDREDSMLYNHIAEGLYPSAMPSFLHREDTVNGVKFEDEYIKKMVRYVRHFHEDNKPLPNDVQNNDTGNK